MLTLLSYEEASAYTGGALSVYMLKRAVTRRWIACVKPSGPTGPTYFRAEDLDRYIAARRKPAEVGPAAEPQPRKAARR